MKNTDKFIVKVKNRQTDKGDTEYITERGEGSLRIKDGKYYIMYKTDSATVMIRLEMGYANVTRVGESRSDMEYRAGKTTRFMYNTPYGAMEMELAPIPGETMTLAEIDHQLDALNKRFQMLLSKAAEDGSEPYTEQFKAIVEETTALKDRKRAIETLRKENAEANHHIAMAVATMQNASAELTQWDEPTIRQLVDTVKVISADEIIVYLRGSVEIRQEIIQ